MDIYRYIETYDSVNKLNSAIQEGIDLNTQNKTGFTALHLAVANERYFLVRMLVMAGVDLNIVDDTGFTPLHWAIHLDNPDIAKLLIDNGAKNIETHKGTPYSLLKDDSIIIDYLKEREGRNLEGMYNNV